MNWQKDWNLAGRLGRSATFCFVALSLSVSTLQSVQAAGLDRLDSGDFLHQLEFDDDGIIPSVEGATFEEGGEGWVETGTWQIDGETAPSLSVADGFLTFDTTGQGIGPGRAFSIDQPNGPSAWNFEVNAEVSYTFEARLRVTGPEEGAESAPDTGAALWLADGTGQRIVVVVDDDQIRLGANSDAIIHEGDNSSEFVTIRITRDADTGTYFVWRDGVLIAREANGTAADARSAVFLIDYGSNNEAAGQLDYVRWDSGGAYAPEIDATDVTPPAAPTGLTTLGEDGRVVLNWDADLSDVVYCYTVKRASSEGGPYQVIDDAVLSNEYIDTTVTNGITYYYVVTATDTNGNESEDSAEESASPDAGQDATPPAAPTGLTASGSADGTIVLDWDDNIDEDLAGYRVKRSTAAGGPYQTIEADSGISDFEDADVEGSTRYYYVVTAFDGADNESPSSNEANAILTTSIDDEIEKTADEFPHSLQFETNDVLPQDEGAADGWTIDAFNTLPDSLPPSLFVEDGVLKFETALAGQWSVINQAAWTEETDGSSSYTFEARIRVTAADGASGGATLWAANGSDRIILRVLPDSIVKWTGNELLHEGDNATEFVNIRIAYDAISQSYFVWRDGALIGADLPNDGAAAGGRKALFLLDCCSSVQATGEADYFAWDASGAFFPPTNQKDQTPPATPTGLAGAPEDSRAHLSWNANVEEDFGGYRLLRSEISGGPYESVFEGGATSYIDELLTNDVEYFYVITAVDINRNESDRSAEVSVTPQFGLDITPPETPTGLVARATLDGEVNLSWGFAVDIDTVSYNVHRADQSGGPYDLIAEGIDVIETTYTDDAVDLGTTYFYVVASVDSAANTSDFSAEASATPELFDGFDERAADSFAHSLLFDEDGVLPSVEGIGDGWGEDAAWNTDSDVPPALSVSDGLLHFNSVLPGQQSITMQAGSAWENEVDPGTSWTFETSLRVIATDAPNPGAILWFANGDTRLILRVDLNGLFTFSGEQLDDNDNSTEFVTIRVAYHAATSLYFVWRNEVLVGDGVGPDGQAAGGRTAVFLIDCCSSTQAQGELDEVYWDATGAYAPGEDIIDPSPKFARGDADANGNLNLTDAIVVLGWLFLGGDEPPCLDSADADDSGVINLTDAVRILGFLFLGGDAPADPGPPGIGNPCGSDAEGDLGCIAYEACA